MGVPTPTRPEDLDVRELTFDAPDLTTFARLDELGLVAVGQRVEPDRAVLECRVVAGDDDAFGRHCGAEGRRVLIDDPTRFDGLPVVIDLTPIRDGTGRARSPRPPRPGRRSALLRAADPAHWRQPAHRQAGPQDRVPVRRRGARRGRGDLGHLPTHDRRLLSLIHI